MLTTNISTMKNTCLFLACFTVLVGCSKSKQNQIEKGLSETSVMACMSMEARIVTDSKKSENKGKENVSIDPKTHEKKIIKDGKIGLQTDSVEAVKVAISLEIKK